MTPKNLLQSLKSNLERESQFEDRPLNVWVQSCEEVAKARIAVFIEGKWEFFEVMARPMGTADGLQLV